MKNYDGATIKRLMKYIAGHAKGSFILSIICVLISTAANVSGSMFIQVLVDEYIEPLLLEDNPVFTGLIKVLIAMGSVYLIGVSAPLSTTSLWLTFLRDA